MASPVARNDANRECMVLQTRKIYTKKTKLRVRIRWTELVLAYIGGKSEGYNVLIPQ